MQLVQSIHIKVSYVCTYHSTSSTSILYGGNSRSSTQEIIERLEDSISHYSQNINGSHQRSIQEYLDLLKQTIVRKFLHMVIIMIQEVKYQYHESLVGGIDHIKVKHCVSYESSRDETNKEGRFEKYGVLYRSSIRYVTLCVGLEGSVFNIYLYGHGMHVNQQDLIPVTFYVDTEDEALLPDAYQCHIDSNYPRIRTRGFIYTQLLWSTFWRCLWLGMRWKW